MAVCVCAPVHACVGSFVCVSMHTQSTQQFHKKEDRARKNYCANCIENKYISIWHIHCLLCCFVAGLGLDYWVGLGWAGLHSFHFAIVNVFCGIFLLYVFFPSFCCYYCHHCLHRHLKVKKNRWQGSKIDAIKCHRNAGFIVHVKNIYVL